MHWCSCLIPVNVPICAIRPPLCTYFFCIGKSLLDFRSCVQIALAITLNVPTYIYLSIHEHPRTGSAAQWDWMEDKRRLVAFNPYVSIFKAGNMKSDWNPTKPNGKINLKCSADEQRYAYAFIGGSEAKAKNLSVAIRILLLFTVSSQYPLTTSPSHSRFAVGSEMSDQKPIQGSIVCANHFPIRPKHPHNPQSILPLLLLGWNFSKGRRIYT